MNTKDIWITGVGLVSSLGEGPEPHLAALAAPAPAPVLDEASFAPFAIHPLPPLELDRQIPKKGDQRQMEPWQRFGTYAAGLAIDHAAARELVAGMHLIVSAGGGERDIALDESICAELAKLPPAEIGPKLNELLANGLRPTLFLAQLSNLLAGNISIVHGVIGSSRTFMGEEEAAADAVRILRARLAEGRGEIGLVGGACLGGRWDMLMLFNPGEALWRGPWVPLPQRLAQGGGMVLGTVAAFLVLESAEHARARGARGLARLTTVATDAARRRGEDTAEAAALGLFERLRPALKPGYGVLSGATGIAEPTASEQAFLAEAARRGPAQGPVRFTGDILGHAPEASFAANLALGALSLADGNAAAPPQIMVTGFGQWRGEALALLEPIDEVTA